MEGLLPQFVRSFTKAVQREMEAMRRALGPFEVPLVDPEPVEIDETGRHVARYRLLEPNDKLVPAMECSLRSEEGEALVTVVGLERLRVCLACDRPLPSRGDPLSLVIYPWFLYERLIQALEAILESPTHFPATALRAFGKGLVVRREVPFRTDPEGLNESQTEALRLCSESNIAFVWGPPGTGKTTTLARIVSELAAQGMRVLITSTTNAAVDQALGALAHLPAVEPLFAQGEILRIGRSEAPTYGAEAGEAVKRLGIEARAKAAHLVRERERLAIVRAGAEELASELATAFGSLQLRLFDELPSLELAPSRLAGILPPEEVPGFVALPAAAQGERLRALASACAGAMASLAERVAGIEAEARVSEATLIAQARVLLATLAGVTVNRTLAAERFDAVVIEEAGMAVLPAIFACAALSREKVILIGDPRQLPSIVYSSDPYVHRAMGRSIFEVAPGLSPLALLDVQYRMHPAIGELVSHLYYEGRLRNAPGVEERRAITGKSPFAGEPIVLVDSGGFGRCETAEGSYSRANRATAELCIALAAAAVADGVESVAVITPYVEQARLVRQLLGQRRLSQVECRTVHRFQGNERDYVILDTVDGEPYAPGVLLAGEAAGSQASNLLNVSISRARGKLLLIADLPYFRARAADRPIGRLLEAVALGGRVVPASEAVSEGARAW